ncbi:MAG: tryptophan synthase subunit alpha [Candidatus Walczuchella monophlebidarum]
MNIIDHLFKKGKNNLSIYFTAGYPKLNSTKKIIKLLQKYKVNLIEIGLPYSDPMADGLIIQKSNKKALKNGMNPDKLFDQLQLIQNEIQVPLILMGYYNQFFKFGEEYFLNCCKKSGISGIIFPDLPIEIYKEKYQKLFEKYELYFICLVTSQTTDNRIILLSNISKGFLYVVSSISTTGYTTGNTTGYTTGNTTGYTTGNTTGYTTGNTTGYTTGNTTGSGTGKKKDTLIFLNRINKLNLSIPTLIGFGIANKNSFNLACQYANGGIIGSAFIQSLDENDLEGSIHRFIASILI